MSERAHFSIEQRESLLQKFQQSGMTVTDFARANGLSRELLSVWVWRYVRKPALASAAPAGMIAEVAPPRFQEIELGSLFSHSSWAAELILPGGACLKLSSHGLEQIVPHLQNHFGLSCSR